MFDDHFETPTVAVAGFTDGDLPPPFASDRLLAEIGLPAQVIREIRGFPPGPGADG